MSEKLKTALVGIGKVLDLHAEGLVRDYSFTPEGKIRSIYASPVNQI